MSRGTKSRNVRADDDLWLPAKEKAEADGTTVSDVIREYLTFYTAPAADTVPEPVREFLDTPGTKAGKRRRAS